jgi:hypothetical protein
LRSRLSRMSGFYGSVTDFIAGHQQAPILSLIHPHNTPSSYLCSISILLSTYCKRVSSCLFLSPVRATYPSHLIILFYKEYKFQNSFNIILIIGFCFLLRVILTVNNNTFCFATIDKVFYYVRYRKSLYKKTTEIHPSNEQTFIYYILCH